MSALSVTASNRQLRAFCPHISTILSFNYRLYTKQQVTDKLFEHASSIPCFHSRWFICANVPWYTQMRFPAEFQRDNIMSVLSASSERFCTLLSPRENTATHMVWKLTRHVYQTTWNKHHSVFGVQTTLHHEKILAHYVCFNF